jgi:hypothetical protein
MAPGLGNSTATVRDLHMIGVSPGKKKRPGTMTARASEAGNLPNVSAARPGDTMAG